MSMDHARDSGLNVENAQDIIDALEAQHTLGTVNVGMDVGDRSQEPEKGQGPKAYTGIDAIYDREYEYDASGRFSGVRLRQFFCLGEGRVVSAAALRGLWRSVEFDAGEVSPVMLQPTGGAACVASTRKPSLEQLWE